MSTDPQSWRDPPLRWLLWRLVGRFLYRFSFHNWYRFRHRLLAIHGAKLGPDTKFRRTTEVDRPWNLSAGTLAMFGDNVLIQARAPVTIGDRAVLSQLSIVLTACRDPLLPDCPLKVAPVVLDNDCWVAADSLVLPGSIIHEGGVVGARSVVSGEIPEWRVAAGDPAVPRGKRQWPDPPGAQVDEAEAPSTEDQRQ